MNKLLLAILLVPVLCFAHIGDTKEDLQKFYGKSPSEIKVFNKRTALCVFTNGQVFAVIGLLDNKSVIESIFDRDGTKVPSAKLEEFLASYGDKWYPVPDTGNSKTVESFDKTIKISYGDLIMGDNGEVVPNVITVMHCDSAIWLLESKKLSL